MNIQNLITTRLGMGFALTVAKCPSPRIGHAIARFVAHRLAAHPSSTLLRSLRANQWVVRGGTPSRAELDEAARNVLVNAGCSFYDFYHSLNRPKAIRRIVAFDAKVSELLGRMREAREGLIVVAPHLSNFDLVVQAALHQGVQTQILTLNNGAPAYRMQDHLRNHRNLVVTPVSLPALKMAVQRLREGGSVVTGIDRPLRSSRVTPRFFGRPAPLPVHHVYLALKVKVPVYVVSVRRDADGIYQVGTSAPIAMKSFSRQDEETTWNAERILKAAEDAIREAPEQWSMFYPVWPDVPRELKAGRPMRKGG